MGIQSYPGHADPYLSRNSPNGGVGAASVQYWRWGAKPAKVCLSPERQSSKGLDPETSCPAAFSTGAKLGRGRLATCCGQFCLQRSE